MTHRRVRKLTDDQVHAIRASTEAPKILAARYGVQRSYISRLRNRTRKQLIPDLLPNVADPGPEPELVLGSMKAVTIIANLRKDIARVQRQFQAGDINAECAKFELLWMRRLIEYWQQKIVHAAKHPPPAATTF